MNRHLSPEQISRWMIGERTAEEERHGRECPACSEELAHFQTVLSRFRDAVRNWSSTVEGGGQIRAAPPRLRVRPLAVAAALCLLAVVPIYRNAKERQREAAVARADALLLDEVNAQISRTVPAPLEPLTRLVWWGPGSENRQGEVR